LFFLKEGLDNFAQLERTGTGLLPWFDGGDCGMSNDRAVELRFGQRQTVSGGYRLCNQRVVVAMVQTHQAQPLFGARENLAF
jgi:hypothetical protein